MSFLTKAELAQLKLASYGNNVLISRRAAIYFPEKIAIGSNVRIDDFCVLTARGGLTIGDYVHISTHCCLFGGSGIEIQSFAGTSPACNIFSESDDFSGLSAIHPFFPEKYRPGLVKGKVVLEEYAQLGAGTTVLPGCTIGKGSVTGAHSLVNSTIHPWGIYVGCPVKKICARSQRCIQQVETYLSESSNEINLEVEPRDQ